MWWAAAAAAAAAPQCQSATQRGYATRVPRRALGVFPRVGCAHPAVDERRIGRFAAAPIARARRASVPCSPASSNTRAVADRPVRWSRLGAAAGRQHRLLRGTGRAAGLCWFESNRLRISRCRTPKTVVHWARFHFRLPRVPRLRRLAPTQPRTNRARAFLPPTLRDRRFRLDLSPCLPDA
jgi:hypothetical protein